jgi:serine/threonine protein kinase
MFVCLLVCLFTCLLASIFLFYFFSRFRPFGSIQYSLLGQVYGREVDMWALGVTTFILLGGYAPFDGDNDTEVFTAILTLDYKYISPEWDHVGPVGKDFIDSLLKLEASKRLTARQALLHPFIVNNVAPELRKLPEVKLGSEGPEFATEPRAACLSVIQTFTQIVKGRLENHGIKPEHAREDQLIHGELSGMLKIVTQSGANSARDLTDYERLVLETTWERLQQLRPHVYV